MDTIKVLCGPCEFQHRTTSSVSWCLDCEDGYCADCAKSHVSIKAMRNHQLISINEYTKAPIEMNAVCKPHEKKFDFFCKDHDEIACVACIPTTHKKCQNVVSLEDAANNIKSSALLLELEEGLSDGISVLDKMALSKLDNAKSLDMQKMKIESEIRTTVSDMIKHIHALQETLLRSLELKHKACKAKLKDSKVVLEEKKEKFKELKETAKKVKEVASDVQIFLMARSVLKNYKEEELACIKVIDDNPSIDLDFRTEHFAKTILDIKSFGKIDVTKRPNQFSLKSQMNKQAPIIRDTDLQLKLRTKFYIKPHKEEHGILYADCKILPNNEFAFLDGATQVLFIQNESGSTRRKLNISYAFYGPCDFQKVTEDIYAVSYCYEDHVDLLNIRTNQIEDKIKFPETHGNIQCISYYSGELFLSFEQNKIYVLDVSRRCHTRTIAVGEEVWHLAVNKCRIYYLSNTPNKLYCCDMNGKSIWTFESENLGDSIRSRGRMTIDPRGHVIVTCSDVKRVMVVSPDGKHCQILLDEKDGLKRTKAVHCDPEKRQLLVCLDNYHAALYDIV